MLTLPTGIHLNSDHANRLLYELHNIDRSQRFSYDWKKDLNNDISLEEKIKDIKGSKLPFIGYGSLINSSSAKKTFDQEIIITRRPVIVFGARRIFNYSMDSAVTRYGTPENKQESAALNINVTGSLDDTFNAILLELPPGEIPALREREIDYDLEPVVYIDWHSDKKDVDVAYALICPDNAKIKNKRIDNSLFPHREYYKVCKEGAGEFGGKFLQYWLETTYLADGNTPVMLWESCDGIKA